MNESKINEVSEALGRIGSQTARNQRDIMEIKEEIAALTASLRKLQLVCWLLLMSNALANEGLNRFITTISRVLVGH